MAKIQRNFYATEAVGGYILSTNGMYSQNQQVFTDLDALVAEIKAELLKPAPEMPQLGQLASNTATQGSTVG